MNRILLIALSLFWLVPAFSMQEAQTVVAEQKKVIISPVPAITVFLNRLQAAQNQQERQEALAHIIDLAQTNAEVLRAYGVRHAPNSAAARKNTAMIALCDVIATMTSFEDFLEKRYALSQRPEYVNSEFIFDTLLVVKA